MAGIRIADLASGGGENVAHGVLLGTAPAGAAPWAVSPQAFPYGGRCAVQLRSLVSYAVLAPSGHNTQPWLFRIGGSGGGAGGGGEDCLDLLADRTRALPVVDPHDRALVISCGASLTSLLIAGRHFGLWLDVEMLPDPGEPDLLARVRIRQRSVRTTPEDERLFDAIPLRRTNRRPFEPGEPPAEVLREAAARCGSESGGKCTVQWITGGMAGGTGESAVKHEVAKLIAEGDRAQMSDPRFRRELASWVHSRRSASRDGLSGYAMGMPDVLSAVGALIIRTFDMGKGQAARDQALAEGSPALAVLTTPGDGPIDWLAAGRGMQGLLLSLTSAGLSASFLNQPIEVESLRPALARAISSQEHPQVLLRIGKGPALDPAMRRDAGDVIIAS